ncbi:C2H2-type zinc finger protein [Candidatus Nitrosocosmicus hydrocola]|uniref:C2H2-type zinc finger protein n=1 Tax=Candidatus Nitrosocosmicus hydrocola TaxID=1826872 RepID=UPI0011E5FCC1|nr:C2H2-type zinc finger protein [Candidatus Nitrosocosmicus hydrocola]
MYTCNICNLIFSRKWNYKRHLNRKHPLIVSKVNHEQNKDSAFTSNEPGPIKEFDMTNPIVQKLHIDLFQSMELLEKYLTGPQKNEALSAALLYSLSARNPVKDLEERANLLYATYCKNHLIHYISRGNSMEYSKAKTVFEGLLTSN